MASLSLKNAKRCRYSWRSLQPSEIQANDRGRRMNERSGEAHGRRHSEERLAASGVSPTSNVFLQNDGMRPKVQVQEGDRRSASLPVAYRGARVAALDHLNAYSKFFSSSFRAINLRRATIMRHLACFQKSKKSVSAIRRGKNRGRDTIWWCKGP